MPLQLYKNLSVHYEIKTFASGNGFRKSIWTSIIKRTLNKSINNNHSDDDTDTLKFYLNISYFGRARGILVKSVLKR